MIRKLLKRSSELVIGLVLVTALWGSLGLVGPQQSTTTSGGTQLGVQYAEAKPKKKKKAKKPAKPKANVPVACPSIATRTITNIPRAARGTSAQQFSFTEQVKCVVNATPRGQTIWITIYSYEIPSVVDALIKAHRRGVNVRVTSWGERAHFPQTRRLMAALGKNPRARSYAISCVGSCLIGGTVGIHHAKGIAISMAYRKVGRRAVAVKDIVFVGSANFSYGNSVGSWNTTQLVVGDPRLYAGLAGYISATRWDRYQRLFPAVRSVSGKYEIHFSPAKKSDDPIYSLLKSVKCTYKERGIKKRTVIRISVYKWTQGQMRLLKQIQKLKKKGCNIAVITATTKREADILAKRTVRPLRSIVSARLAYSRIPVYDSTWGPSANSKPVIGTHDKSIAVAGALKKRKGTQYVAIMGGRNWTSDGLKENAEIMMVARDYTAVRTLFVSWNRQQRLAIPVRQCARTKWAKKHRHCPRERSRFPQ